MIGEGPKGLNIFPIYMKICMRKPIYTIFFEFNLFLQKKMCFYNKLEFIVSDLISGKSNKNSY